MTNHTYRKTAGTVFAVVAVFHAIRLLYGWEAVIGGLMMPMWVSWFGVIFAGWLVWSGLKK